MKNKIFKLIYTLVFAFSFAVILYSDEIDIKTTEINILESGKLLTGSKGFNIITDKNVEITGNKFSYNKEIQELNAEGNVNIIDQLNEIKINSEVVEYNQKEEKFYLKNKATINYKNNYTLYGEDIIYMKNENKIFSKKKIKVIDSFSEEEKIIIPAIRALKNKKINAHGPFSADTFFQKKNLKKFQVVIGMYHDQVLTPIKTLYKFDAINITLGLPYLRISPDHGTNNEMIGQKKSDPQSLYSAINFFTKI